jgi:hypothetical protein
MTGCVPVDSPKGRQESGYLVQIVIQEALTWKREMRAQESPLALK